MYYVIVVFVITAAFAAAAGTYIVIVKNAKGNAGCLAMIAATIVLFVTGVLLGNLVDPLASQVKPRGLSISDTQESIRSLRENRDYALTKMNEAIRKNDAETALIWNEKARAYENRLGIAESRLLDLEGRK